MFLWLFLRFSCVLSLFPWIFGCWFSKFPLQRQSITQRWCSLFVVVVLFDRVLRFIEAVFVVKVETFLSEYTESEKERLKREREIVCFSLVLMGTRAGRKEDFVGGFGFGLVENSLKDVMVLPNHHHHPSYSSPSSSSFCYCSVGVGDPMFSASSNSQTYTPSPTEMFCLAGSGSVSVADPFFTLTSSGFKLLTFCDF